MQKFFRQVSGVLTWLLTAKCLLAMRLMILLLLAAVLQVSAKGYTQTVTISIKNASLEKVFAEIKKQTGYSFLYTDQMLAGTSKVSINVKSATIEQVLEICFKDQSLTYTIVNKTIVLKPKEQSPNAVATNVIASEAKQSPSIDISGKITDADGNPLSGATVKVKGTNKLTNTNNDGVFVLKDVDENASLEISFVGYQTTTVSISNRTSIAASLKLNIVTNPEVIVRKGYYNEKRATTTGNVGTITSKEIEKQPVNNPLLAMQGRITGIEINQATGLSGTAVTVQIRGRNSIANGNKPLYIIDGVPYSSSSINIGSDIFGYGSEGPGSNPFSFINPADVESIDVLKDADATAIYGSRGANGVVLITTKRGKQGKMKLDVNLQTGIGQVAHKMDMLNTRQYLDMRYEALRNDGALINPNTDFDLALWDTTRYTDWQKELIGGKAHYNDMQAAISGGNELTQYRIGAGYHKETTVFPGDFNDQKASVHFNINSTSLNKKFGITLSGVYTSDNNHLPSSDLTEQAVLLAPDAPALYNPDGSINWAPGPSGASTWPFHHPLQMLLSPFETKTNNLIGNAVLRLQIAKGLDLKTSLGYTTLQSNDFVGDPLSAQDPYTWPFIQRSSRFADNQFHSWIIEPQLTYSKNISKGSFSGLIGTTILQNESTGNVIDAKGFNSDLSLKDMRSATNLVAAASANAVYKYNALFTRFNYNWDDRYILNITARRDGTSRFGPSNRFHNFGAAGAGWVFSKENFFKRNINILSFGKLRGSYGTSGSDQVGDYSYMDLYTSLPAGNPYQGTIGTTPSRIYTPDLAWEETKKLEAALELRFFNDRLNLVASFYRNRSSNQLLSYNLPSVTGFTSVMKNLDANVQNKGWEFELRTTNLNKKDVQWSTSFNLTINRNRLLSVSDGVSDFLKKQVGNSLNTIFVYKYLGVDFLSGLYQVTNQHGTVTNNPTYNDALVPINMSTKFYGGLGNTINYKKFQLDFLFQFSERPEAALNYINYIPGLFSSSRGSNQLVYVLDRWQKPGDIKSVQRFSQNLSTLKARENFLNSEGAYGDVSYIRLKNLSLSWQLPGSWTQKLHIYNSRIYVQGQNLWTITNYKGLDPETIGYLRLPPLRVITFGIQMTL